MSAATLERQIKPIYDALDTGSNKSAIVACNKLLKKHPKNDLLKALKALALVRSQKVEESLVLCDEVLESKPTDDGILNAMLHVLRSLGRQKDMVTMFEEAYKKQPANEELAAQTFFANVRAGQWKSAQQIATKMHKSFQEDRYLYWSVISAVLQANDSITPPQMRELLYKLAHRLISSAISPSHASADRFYLHLTILRELKLLDEAHELLDSEVGKSICATNLLCDELRRDIWRLKELTKEEGVIAENRIVENKDRNWLEFLSVLDATFVYVPKDSTEISEDAKAQCLDHIAKTEALFKTVAEQDGSKDRTGLLGLLELERRSREYSLSTEPTKLVDLMEKYFELIGSKACCFEDLKPYLDLEGEELDRWTTFLNKVDPSSETPKQLQRIINSFKLIRYNLPESEANIDAETARLGSYISYYEAGLKLGKDLPSTELQYADDLALLAANILVSLWQLSEEDKYLYNAAALLEFALQKSKQSFQFRMLLIRIYRILGAPSLAIEHYRSMRIKQIQNDTLSYLMLARASTFSQASTGDLTFPTECIESSQIYLSNSQETNEFVVRAFTSEKYSQIPDFIAFEERLEGSLQRDLVKIEHLRMRLTHEPIVSDLIDMELIELKFIFDRTHYDNRDLTIMSSYQPKISDDVEAQTRLFGQLEGFGWLNTYLKVYIRAFQQGSDLDDTVEEKLLIGDRPKQSTDPEKNLPLKDRLKKQTEEELEELTPEETLFVEYATALADWLEPYHDYSRPPPHVVLAEAAKQTEIKTGYPLKGVDMEALNGAATPTKKDEEPPAIVEAPEAVVKYFDEIQSLFETAQKQSSPVQALHIASLAQEAFLLLTVETLRFKSTSVVKINKLGALVSNFKTLKTNAIAVLKNISTELGQLAENEGTADARKVFVDACSSIKANEIDQDFILGIGKKVTDARKKVLEGAGKGISRVCTTYSQ